MLTRKQRHTTAPIEEFVSIYVSTYFGQIKAEDFTYLDEVYRVIANRLAALRDLKAIQLWVLGEYDGVSSEPYMYLFNKSLLLAELNYRMIPYAFDNLQRVTNSILESAEYLSSQLSICNDIVKGMEGGLKQKLSASSIKDEIIYYDTLGSESSFLDGNLSIDKRAGCMTLGVTGATSVPFTLDSIVIDKPKGIITTPGIGDPTWESVYNGYFNSRTFSASPIFETDAEKDITQAIDGDLETGYLVEYNSTSDRESLTVELNLSFPRGKIDLVSISVDPSDRQSVHTSETILPDVARIILKKDEQTDDVTLRALDNTVDIKGAILGEVESMIVHKRPDIYPTGSFFLCEADATGLTIDLLSAIPQQISFPEKVVRDGSNHLQYRFNYFETLVLNKYEPPLGYLNPATFYTAREIAEFDEIVAAGSNVADELQLLNRYFIGVKEITLLSLSYEEKGYMETDNLNTSDKSVAAVELYVNEYVPEGTTITYSFSPDRIVWEALAPSTRITTGDLPRRLVFEGFDVLSGDKYIPVSTQTLFMKIEMTGAAGISPMLKSYAVRTKLL